MRSFRGLFNLPVVDLTKDLYWTKQWSYTCCDWKWWENCFAFSYDLVQCAVHALVLSFFCRWVCPHEYLSTHLHLKTESRWGGHFCSSSSMVTLAYCIYYVSRMANEIAEAKEAAELLKQENFRWSTFCFTNLAWVAFQLNASSDLVSLVLFSRLLIQSKEFDCREDPEMRDLKEDLLKFSDLLGQLDTRKAKLTFLEDAEVCF